MSTGPSVARTIQVGRRQWPPPALAHKAGSHVQQTASRSCWRLSNDLDG
ncbi:MAG: hypothetical protein ACFFBD_03435 [Candidatus Hodarchaeota archaeon]